MLEHLKAMMRAQLMRRGYSVERHTDVDAAAALGRKMWPLRTQHPLRRFGGANDGGYLVPDDLAGIAAVISPGVCDNASFEEAFAAMGIDCFMLDASVDGPPIDNPRFDFTKKFLGVHEDETFTTLDAFVAAKAPGAEDLLLQIDIEGAEWGVLANVSHGLLERFRIIVAEFHHVERILYSQTERSVLERLLRRHAVVHMHVNNFGVNRWVGEMGFPDYLEVTYLRRDRIASSSCETTFPHPLDAVNIPDRPPLELPPNWHAPRLS